MSDANKKIAPQADRPQFRLVPIDLQHRDAGLLHLCARAAVLRNRCETVGIDIYRCPMPPDAYNRFRLTTAMIKMEVEQ
jgi:hypothetical protein